MSSSHVPKALNVEANTIAQSGDCEDQSQTQYIYCTGAVYSISYTSVHLQTSVALCLRWFNIISPIIFLEKKKGMGLYVRWTMIPKVFTSNRN